MPHSEGLASERRSSNYMALEALTRTFNAIVPVFPQLGLDIEILDRDSAEEVLRFRQDIFAGLTENDLVLPEPDEPAYVAAMLGTDGVTIALRKRSNGELVGYGSLMFPGEDGDLAMLSGLPPSLLSRSAEIASCMLARSVRGHRLQRAFLSARERIAWSRGRSYLQVMTSPNNGPSRHNLLVAGYLLDWAGWVPDPRRVRLVLAKDLLARKLPAPHTTTMPPDELNTRTARLRIIQQDDYRRISVADPDALMDAVANNWVSFVDDWKTGEMVFYRPENPSQRHPDLHQLLNAAIADQRHFAIEHILNHGRPALAALNETERVEYLVLAARHSCLPVIEALVQMGTPPNGGNGVVIATAALAGSESCLRFLLANGGNPRAQYAGESGGALIAAARLGHSQAVQVLLEASLSAGPDQRFSHQEVMKAIVNASSALSFGANESLRQVAQNLTSSPP
jgi:Ankyrin repeats (3 copies)